MAKSPTGIFLFYFNILFISCLASARCLADTLITTAFIETGSKSTADIFDEEDDDSDFSYDKYYSKIDYKDERLRCLLSYLSSDKDYINKDTLDNRTDTIHTDWSYLFKETKEDTVKLNIDLKYRERRYANSKTNNYDQFNPMLELAFKEKDIWSLAMSTGLSDYHYPEAQDKDQLKRIGKIEVTGFIVPGTLETIASYRREESDRIQAGKDTLKDISILGFDYKVPIPYIRLIRFRIENGERDTKDEEERDEDLDYSYQRWYVTTQGVFSSRFSSTLKYQHWSKDYLTQDLDHRAFYITSNSRYDLINKDAMRIYLNLELEHKETDYTINDLLSYDKDSLETRATYKMDSWKHSLGVRTDHYDYPQDPSNNRDTYHVKVSIEKGFNRGDSRLSLDLKYKLKDFDADSDTEQDSIRLTFEQRF
ncbi:MAG: hypothetical protein HYV48_05200 [Candidatus Omnitrophica bacterium]|nr:hypothetical protein [Candidatus Omnitrophota bacterium]